MTAYRGFDVLDQVPHNAREAVAESFSRLGVLVANPTGRRTFDDHAEISFPARSFQWTAGTRERCAALRAFLNARQGRLVPFWTPTFCWDLTLVVDGDGGPSLTIAGGDYVQFLWPSLARRDVLIAVPGQAFVYRRVTAAELSSGNSLLTLDSGVGFPAPAATTRISFLALCRLAEDMTTLEWSHPNTCEASIRFVEIPREVPA